MIYAMAEIEHRLQRLMGLKIHLHRTAHRKKKKVRDTNSTCINSSLELFQISIVVFSFFTAFVCTQKFDHFWNCVQLTLMA